MAAYREREGADTASAVRDYYESNTWLFLSLGIGRQTLAIRRAVWAEGVESLADAVNFVNGLVAAEARRAVVTDGELRVLDIGCGVGGSLFFLAEHGGAPLQGIGVTISPRQAAIARRQTRIRGLSAKLSFIAADFARLPDLSRFHLAFAIESFVHFAAPEAFFTPAARSLAPGGRLIVVDDFLSRDRHSRKERRLVHAFRQGWLLLSLCTVGQAVQTGADAGMQLVEDRDLSGLLARSTLSPGMSGWAVRIMQALPVPWPYWRSSAGSLALAACRQAGLVEYHVLVFEKPRA